jgi:drug/metabolite transporter (DMT)-like permease
MSTPVGTLFSLLSVIFMSAAPILNKFTLVSVNPLFASLVNSIIGAAFFLSIYFVRENSKVPTISKHALLSGIFNALGLILMFFSLREMNPAVLGFLGRMSVVFAFILSALFLGKMPDKVEVALAIFTLLGALGSAIGDHNHQNILGVLFALGYILCFSLSNLCLKLGSEKKSNCEILGLMNLISAFFLGQFYVFFGDKTLPAGSTSWLLLFVGALFGTCLGLWFYLKSLKIINFSRAAVIRLTGPLFTAAMAYPFFGLQLNFWQGTSAVVLLASIAFLAIHERRKVSANSNFSAQLKIPCTFPPSLPKQTTSLTP